MDEGVENGGEDSKLVEQAEPLSLVTLGDVLETRVGEESGFELRFHGFLLARITIVQTRQMQAATIQPSGSLKVSSLERREFIGMVEFAEDVLIFGG